MPTLIVKRSNNWINHFRKYKIYVNGEMIGKIANANTNEFKVPNGNIEIKAKIDWCHSKEINLSMFDDNSKSIKISTFKYSDHLVIGYIITFCIYFFSDLFFDFSNKILNVITVAYSLILMTTLIYYLTIGRRSLIKITDISNENTRR